MATTDAKALVSRENRRRDPKDKVRGGYSMNNEDADKQLTVWQVDLMMGPIPWATKVEEIHPVAVSKYQFCIGAIDGCLEVYPFGPFMCKDTHLEYEFFRTSEEADACYLKSQKTGIAIWLAQVETLLNNATQLPYMAETIEMVEQGNKHNNYEEVMGQLNGFFRNWKWLDRLKYLTQEF